MMMVMMMVIWWGRGGGGRGGGGISPVITPAPRCQHHDRTVYWDPFSNGAASRWLSAGTAAAGWRFTFPPSSSWFVRAAARCEAGAVRLTLTHTPSRTPTAASLARTLDRHILPRLLRASIWGFGNLRDFIAGGEEEKSRRTDKWSLRWM